MDKQASHEPSMLCFNDYKIERNWEPLDTGQTPCYILNSFNELSWPIKVKPDIKWEKGWAKAWFIPTEPLRCPLRTCLASHAALGAHRQSIGISRKDARLCSDANSPRMHVGHSAQMLLTMPKSTGKPTTSAIYA